MPISEEKRAYNRAYYQLNKEKIKNRVKEYYLENRERCYAKQEEWRLANPERVAATRQAWREKNADAIKARQRIRTRESRFAVHGITEADYLSLMEAQEGLCAICRRECDVIDSLSIDHDHETNKVRGLLCKRCNSGLGFFRDDARLLSEAVSYLTGK